MTFKNRFDAGVKLAEVYDFPKNSVLFTIPNGGVQVAYAVSKTKRIPLELIMVKKLLHPNNPEIGFGAINMESKAFLNPKLDEIFSTLPVEEIAKSSLKEILKKNDLFRNSKQYPSLKGKTAVLVDDMFESGYSALAAFECIRKLHPDKIIAIAPVCLKETKKMLENYFDKVYCLIETDKPFVSSFYDTPHNLTDEEVIDILYDLRKENLIYE